MQLAIIQFEIFYEDKITKEGENKKLRTTQERKRNSKKDHKHR